MNIERDREKTEKLCTKAHKSICQTENQCNINGERIKRLSVFFASYIFLIDKHEQVQIANSIVHFVCFPHIYTVGLRSVQLQCVLFFRVQNALGFVDSFDRNHAYDKLHSLRASRAFNPKRKKKHCNELNDVNRQLIFSPFAECFTFKLWKFVMQKPSTNRNNNQMSINRRNS